MNLRLYKPFPWTSCSYHPNRYISKPNSHHSRSAISILVKMFLEKAHSIFATTCMRAINCQPNFTARGTRRASPTPRARDIRILENKRPRRPYLNPFSWNPNFFVKSQFFQEMTSCSWKSRLFHDTHQVKNRKHKIFRTTPKGYRNDPRSVLII